MNMPLSTPLSDLPGPLQQAVSQLLPTAKSVGPAPGRSQLLVVEDDIGKWLLKRWPNGTHPDRIAFVHRLLGVARENGISFVPRLATDSNGKPAVATVDGILFDAVSWLPGRPAARGSDVFDPTHRLINRPSVSSPDHAIVAVRGVAQWHVATKELAADPRSPKASLKTIVGVIRENWERQRLALRPIASPTPHVQRWLKTSETIIDSATAMIDRIGFLDQIPPVIGHLNLWPSHLLFERHGDSPTLTGLIDFENAAATTPLFDVAQLLTHFNGWSGGQAEEALGAYAEINPLAPEERRLLPILAGLELVTEAGRLMTLGYATPSVSRAPGSDAVRASAATLLFSLEALAPAVHRGDEPVPQKTRKWVHKTKKPSAPSQHSPKGDRNKRTT